MTMHAVLAAAATLVSLAFALCTLDRYLARRRRHELVWTISLFLFAAGSLALWAAAALGWSEWTFKAFYLFGAILNVPFLALGTVYLLARRPTTGDRATAVVSLLAAFATGIVVAAPLTNPISSNVFPRGSEVFGFWPRFLAAVGSGIAAIVIIVGALLSAWRLGRAALAARRSDGAVTPIARGALSPARLALANVIIATGTLILSAGGVSNSVLDAMDAFSVSLVVGISVIFAGFLLTNTPTPVPEWRWQPSDLADVEVGATPISVTPGPVTGRDVVDTGT